MLSTLTHKNIVDYYGIAKTDNSLNIFLEYIAGGSISTMIKKFGKLPEQVIGNYIKEILKGLEYLHVNSIIHGDIKGANILIDKDGVAKLSDFGCSKKIVLKTEDKEKNKLSIVGSPN